MSSLFMCTSDLSRWALSEQERIPTIFLSKYASATDKIPPTARRKCLSFTPTCGRDRLSFFDVI